MDSAPAEVRLMRLVSGADFHLHRWPEHDHIDKKLGYSARLADCAGVIDAMVLTAERENADALVIPGDLFHKSGIIETEVFNVAFDRLSYAGKRKQVYLMRGNHDHADKAGKVHSLHAFRSIEGVSVVENEIVRIVGKHGPQDFAFVAYDDNRERLTALAKKLKGDLPAFMHVGFRDAVIGSTIEFPVKEPLNPFEIGKLFAFVYSGHYHKLQFVANNVMYIGSPLEHTRSDVTGDQKGFLVIDTDNLSNPKFVPYKAPRFIRMSMKSRWEEADGNFVDYQLGPDTHQEAEEVHANLIDYGARGINIHPYVEPKAKLKKSDRRVQVAAGMSIKEVVARAAKKRAGGLDPKKLKHLMYEVLREAEKQQ